MSAPILTLSEQKAAVSGKKKKKKPIKNVLNIPRNFEIEPQFIQTNCLKKLEKILERLLPNARLPVVKIGKCNAESNKNVTNDTHLKTEAKNKRNQLSLGVNALNRNIKNELLSAVLLANNIQPKFLIHHLNLLCNFKKIPFLHMPGLREITKNTLGFPCIAVGFKKDFFDFSEAIEEIKSISQSSKITSTEVPLETESDEEVTDDENDESEESEAKNDEVPFTFLYRTSTKERIFLPERSCEDQSQKKQDTGFINVEKFGIETKCKSNPSLVGISSKFRKKMQKLKKLEDFENSQAVDNEDLEVPKKKLKKDWIIDKRGTKNIKYYPANLMKVPMNPNRIKKKK